MGFFIIMMWVLLSFLVGAHAQGKGYSAWLFVVLALLISPLIAWLVSFVLKDKVQEEKRREDQEFMAQRAEADRKRDHEARLEELRALTAAQQTPAPVAPTAPPARSVVEELEKLAALKERGVLTELEFAEQKAAILGRA